MNHYELIFLIVLFSSCTDHKSSINEPIGVSADNGIESSESEPDSSLELNFTSMVRSIFQDSRGNYWFGSDTEGVCRYDGKAFTYFTKKDGLIDNQIRTIQEDQNGHIWFATGNGISRYNGEIFTTHTVMNTMPLSISTAGEWKKEANDLWFNGELDGGIYRYNGQYLEVFKFPVLDPAHESFSIIGTVTGISHGKDDMMWIANYNGVIGYNGQSFTFINERDVKYHVRGIFEDSKGNLWIGNNGIGVLIYDGEKTMKLSEKRELKELSSEQFPYHVFTITEDDNGNIWIGDRDSGAWCFDGQTLKNYGIEDGLTNTFVRVIYKDKKGDLWFGLGDGSVCKFNGKSFDQIY